MPMTPISDHQLTGGPGASAGGGSSGRPGSAGAGRLLSFLPRVVSLRKPVESSICLLVVFSLGRKFGCVGTELIWSVGRMTRVRPDQASMIAAMIVVTTMIFMALSLDSWMPMTFLRKK